MIALSYQGPGSIRLVEVPRPELSDPGEVLVRVTVTSVCGSDLHILHGRMPGVEAGTIVGHEFAGVVEEVGPEVRKFTPGMRVLGPAAVWCGVCRPCREGLASACEKRGIFGCGRKFGDLPGAQAEYVRVPFADLCLREIPPTLSFEEALFAGDILTTAFSAVTGLNPRNPGVRAGDVVAVFGAGPVGLCACASAKLFNPSLLVAVDVEESRLDLARRLGADLTINPAREDVRKAVKDLTSGWGADYLIEAAGVPATLSTAFACAAAGAKISVVGVFGVPVELPVHSLIGKNVSIEMGLGDLTRIDRVLSHLARRELDLTPIITHRMPLSEGERAYGIFDRREEGAVKMLLYPSNTSPGSGA